MINIRVTYSDGSFSKGDLKPGERLVFARPQEGIKDIAVFSKGQQIYNLSRKNLNKLIASAPKGSRDITWNIQTNGIKPLNQAEMEKLRK